MDECEERLTAFDFVAQIKQYLFKLGSASRHLWRFSVRDPNLQP